MGLTYDLKYCCMHDALKFTPPKKPVVSTVMLRTSRTALHCTVAWCTILYCNVVVHCFTMYCATLYFIALQNTVLQPTTLYYTVLHCTTPPYTVLHYTALHCTRRLSQPTASQPSCPGRGGLDSSSHILTVFSVWPSGVWISQDQCSANSSLFANNLRIVQE